MSPCTKGLLVFQARKDVYYVESRVAYSRIARSKYLPSIGDSILIYNYVRIIVVHVQVCI